MTCILCFLNLIENNTIIKLDDRIQEDSELTISDLINLHFQPVAEKIFENSHNNGICNSCWSEIHSFHEFYTSVIKSFEVMQEIIEEENDEVMKMEDEIIVYELIDNDKEKQFCLENQIAKEEIEENSLTEWISEVNEEEVKEYNEIITDFKESQKINRQQINETADERIRQIACMNCEICESSFDSLRDAKNHYKHVHNIEGYIMCCQRKFKQKCRLLEHVNTHFSLAYSCQLCNKTFDSKSYLKKHLATHQTIKEYKCDNCSKTFAKKFQIRNHLISVHMFDNIQPQFECPIENCNKKFVNKARLKHHIDYTHSHKQLEICDICSKTVKSKNALEEHKKTHFRKLEDRIKCSICSHYLSDIKSFNRHLANHATETLENHCNYCGKKSPNLNALRKHIRYVHEMVKKYKCRFCEKSFKRARNLMDHEASVHTLQDLYTCSFCPKTFRNQSNMLSHRKKQHPDLYQRPVYMRDTV
ncbi:hypothetical protein PVAND_011771 [Polypedilum vanderplanki]|uniref:Zinc finger protein n=1 Tax=Polypedilum vanderplanki TaxID=319348 RepID=A0A9J6CJN1_POLVA|nr:hypothetical protein PVAND_011771 [Polypedilum vanderplanki]